MKEPPGIENPASSTLIDEDRAKEETFQRASKKNHSMNVLQLANSLGMRKLKSLPLFDWAEKNQTTVFNPLLITRKLDRHLKMPAFTLNAMAEANGYNGRETEL